MGRNSGRKRKKKLEDGSGEGGESDFSDTCSTKSLEGKMEEDKYKDFRIPNYVRFYPEQGGNFEYVVFIESTKSDQPIGNRDMMSLANCLKRYNKGVKQLQRINKHKIGVIFERPGLANAALQNKKFLDAYSLAASIPAAASEVTGVITHVPIDLSNEMIYSTLTSTKNIVSIRRFMRRSKMDNGLFKLEPTKTVSITFSCPVLPESVDLNSWRFELRPYIPPVKQCLKCLRYGHIAKYCKNSERCSICDINIEVASMSEESDEEVQDNNVDNAKDEDDEVVRAIKAEKNKPRDHPPAINCDDFIVDISFSPVKNMIALANIVGDVVLYEYNNEETKLIETFELHLKACRNVEFNVDGCTMYTTSKDKSIMVTDVQTGKLKKNYENAHEEPVYSLLSFDNDKIVTGDDCGTVKLWDMRKADPVFTLKIGEENISDMITNETQKYLVCAGGDGIITSIDLKAGKIYTTSEDYDSELTCMGLFRSDSKLLVGSSAGKLYLFNWKEFGLHSDEFIGQKHAIQCMVPITQNIVVTSGEDGILRAAHMFPQRQLGIVGQHRLPVECLDISFDGQYIASCSHDNDVKFWNISYFESIDSLIDVNHKQNKKKDMSNNLPSSSVKNASHFYSGLV